MVVAGTHGKTTTAAMMGALLHHAGRDPSFLVGGVTRDFESNFRLGAGPHFVVEGDEYDTAYFDKGPKFLHYRPRTAVFTSCELDHADIYRDEAHYQSAFEQFVDLLPAGRLPGGLRQLRQRAAHRRRARCRVETYAVDAAGADWEARDLRSARTAPASRSAAAARRSPRCTCRWAARTTWRTRWAWPPRPPRSASRRPRSRRGSPPSAG